MAFVAQESALEDAHLYESYSMTIKRTAWLAWVELPASLTAVAALAAYVVGTRSKGGDRSQAEDCRSCNPRFYNCTLQPQLLKL